MREILNNLLPLFAVAVGWFLKELSESFGHRAKHKAAVGKALAELLEARHRIISVEYVVGIFHREYRVPSVAIPHVRTVIEQLMGGLVDIDKNYEDAIRLIAENDPVAAFRFGYGTRAQSMLQGWREFALNAVEHAQTEKIESAEKKFKEIILPNLNELSLSLARYHSLYSYYRVKKMMKKSPVAPEEMKKMMAEVVAIMQENPAGS